MGSPAPGCGLGLVQLRPQPGRRLLGGLQLRLDRLQLAGELLLAGQVLLLLDHQPALEPGGRLPELLTRRRGRGLRLGDPAASGPCLHRLCHPDKLSVGSVLDLADGLRRAVLDLLHEPLRVGDLLGGLRPHLGELRLELEVLLGGRRGHLVDHPDVGAVLEDPGDLDRHRELLARGELHVTGHPPLANRPTGRGHGEVADPGRLPAGRG
jgi:hypothetical protein